MVKLLMGQFVRKFPGQLTKELCCLNQYPGSTKIRKGRSLGRPEV